MKSKNIARLILSILIPWIQISRISQAKIKIFENRDLESKISRKLTDNDLRGKFHMLLAIIHCSAESLIVIGAPKSVDFESGKSRIW